MNPANDVIVRLAELADLDMILEIRRRAIVALAPLDISVEAATAWAHRPDRPGKCRVSIEGKGLWLAVQETRAVGWLEVADDFVNGLYVVPDNWRLGIGSRLMDLAESMIRSRGFAACRLNATTAALAFYQKRGYKPTGPRTPGRGTPMTKALS